MQSAPKGTTIGLNLEVRNASGILVNADITPVVNIVNNSGVTVLSNAAASRVATGVYRYTFSINASANSGIWIADWNCIVSGQSFHLQDPFEVTAANTPAKSGDQGLDEYPLGATATLELVTRDSAGYLTNATNPTVTVSAPNGDILVSGGVPVQVVTGVYRYSYVIPGLGTPGVWVAEWSATIGSVSRQFEEPFKVVVPVGTVAPDSGLQTWTLGETATLQLIVRDGSNQLIPLASPELTIYGPDSEIIVDSVTPTTLAVGVYSYNFETTEEFSAGIWTSQWTGTLDGNPVATQELFELVEPEPEVFDTLLVSVERYRKITGDTATDEDYVKEALADAQRLIEEELDRPLAIGDRTEKLPVINGVVYPIVTPIISADYQIRNSVALVDPSIDGGLLSGNDYPFHATVSYRGGFTQQTLPVRLREAIARTAHRALNTGAVTSSEIPDGAKTIKNGDVSITFGDEGVGSTSSAILPSILDSIRRYRRQEP